MIRSLIDTNVLVYAFGLDTNTAKKAAAVAVLAEHHETTTLTSQVLNEFMSVALRRQQPVAWIADQVRSLTRFWTVLTPTLRTPELALDAIATHQLSLWDALIWAIAREHDISIILSEDGPTGATIGGITYVNPLSSAPPNK